MLSWSGPNGALVAPAVCLERPDDLDILARVPGVANRPIIPIHIGDRLGAVVLVVGVAIDLIAGDPVLPDVVSDFLFAASGVDDDLPSLALEFLQCVEHIAAGRAQNGGTLPAVVFGDDPVEVNRNSPSRIIKFVCHRI